ncbi:M56 family metallopeptidase [Dyadobacter luticola]|uniref:M56 family metallopeptidase n=1 Tax=Dyadobacter luticola TaxID=1979387 RepID=A0A5R9L3Q7_9BACT|nr:M56 family metallopeptidase [Dyadobacter luticola]TLV03183.1 M56 family metallopeptidase [Dyadobacter luticola]
MSPFIEYLIKLSVSLAAVSLFYQLILRRLTFYDWNRWFFIGGTFVSFLIPLINVNQTIPDFPVKTGGTWVSNIPSIHHINPAATLHVAQTQSHTFSYETWVLMLVWVGVAVMLGRFLLQVVFYVRVRKHARLVSSEGVNIYHLEKNVNPFSFGNSIFFNPDLHQPEDLKNIILHEYVHVRQKHSFDIIWSELLCIVCWFNPFVWLIRYAMRQNLEFIADRKVLENHVDARQYQYLLLKVAGVPAYRIANQFSFSSLKQRIIMMNKGKTPQIFLAWFLFSLPLIVLLVVMFRKEIGELTGQQIAQLTTTKSLPKDKKLVHIAGMIMNAETNKPVPGMTLKMTYNDQFVKTITTDERGFYYQKLVVPKIDSTHGMKIGRDKKVSISSHSLSLSYDGSAFASFSFGDLRTWDALHEGAFPVIFAVQGPMPNYRTEFYGIEKNVFFDSFTGDNVREAIYESLSKKLPNYLTEHTLKSDFRKAYPFPKEVITKFRNGYFDRKKELVAYEGQINFILNGKTATYQQVNEAFQDYPYELNAKNEFRSMRKDGFYSQIAYMTLPLYKDAAPAYVVNGNVGWKNVQDFDLEILQKEPYFLDGFRQIYGVESNMMPVKGEIRKVALFTGKLARYYDPESDRIWWIETRPEPEVFERPDIAAK